MKVGAVLLASGGMDSTTLAYWLDKRGVAFIPLFIDYGQHCAATELETLRAVLPAQDQARVEIVSIRDVYRECQSRLIVEPNLWVDEVCASDLYLPYRNLLLLTVGAAVAQGRGCDCLYTAFINSNHAQEIDCSAEFFDRLATVLTKYGTVRVEIPFRALTKLEVARIGISLGVPLGRTFSCQAASVVPCGACPNCVDRLEALSQL